MIVYLIWGILLGVSALAGFITGFVRGFNKLNTWASDFLVATALTILVGHILRNVANVPANIAGIIVVACAVAFTLGCMGISAIVRNAIEKGLVRREDEFESYGAVGVVNRIFGGFTNLVKGFTIAAIITVPLLVVADLSQIGAVKDLLDGLYTGAVWLAIKPFIFDFFTVGILTLAIRHGFASGISGAAWALVVLGLVALSGFISYNLVFSTPTFDGAAASLSATVSGWLGETPLPEGAADGIARWMLTAGLFVIMLLVVILVAIFVSRILSSARLSNAFYVVDGVLGAIVMLIVVLAAMLFVGSVIQPLNDLDFMAPVNSYFGSGTVADYFYLDNLLVLFGMPQVIPLRDWLA